eukprot:5155764-Pyramimonas_sp.AAC.1
MSHRVPKCLRQRLSKSSQHPRPRPIVTVSSTVSVSSPSICTSVMGRPPSSLDTCEPPRTHLREFGTVLVGVFLKRRSATERADVQNYKGIRINLARGGQSPPSAHI